MKTEKGNTTLQTFMLHKYGEHRDKKHFVDYSINTVVGYVRCRESTNALAKLPVGKTLGE